MHHQPHTCFHNTSLLFGTLVLATLASCVEYPDGRVGVSSGYGYSGSRYRAGYASGYGYGYAGLNSTGNYHYYPRYRTYYSPQTRQYYYQQGSSWQAGASPYGVSSRTLFSSPYVPLNLQGRPDHHHDRVSQSYPSHWSPPSRNHDHTSPSTSDSSRYPTR